MAPAFAESAGPPNHWLGAGVPWYDLTFTDGEWARDVRNSLADSHANALGNRLLADKALRALRAAGVLAEEGG